MDRATRRHDRTAFFETPAGYDDPLGMLLGCHRRIEKKIMLEVLDQPESTLLGVAQLAAGWRPRPEEHTRLVEPRAAGRYLAAKFTRWHVWLEQILSE